MLFLKRTRILSHIFFILSILLIGFTEITLCAEIDLSKRQLLSREKPELITYLKGKAYENGQACLLRILYRLDDSKNESFAKDNADTGALDNVISEGISETWDVTSMMLQFGHLSKQDQHDIINCNLNLAPALERCQNVYQKDCETIQWKFINEELDAKEELVNEKRPLPYVTRKCPESFIRIGCCKCMPVCPEKLFTTTQKNGTDKFDYCIKKRTIETPLIKESTIDKTDKNWVSLYEMMKPGWYIKNCARDFLRIGQTMCSPKCPFGWPDLGDRCQKKNRLVQMPFVWQVGDDSLDAKAS